MFLSRRLAISFVHFILVGAFLFCVTPVIADQDVSASTRTGFTAEVQPGSLQEALNNIKGNVIHPQTKTDTAGCASLVHAALF